MHCKFHKHIYLQIGLFIQVTYKEKYVVTLLQLAVPFGIKENTMLWD
jgi:hypothetical protein